MKIDLIIPQLISVLEQESRIYNAMLTVINKEHKATVRSDLDSLILLGNEKENILMKLRIVEDQRIRLIEEMANGLGYPSRELTITMISKLVEEPFAGQLSEAGKALSEILITVKNAGHRNKQLFDHSLELLRGSFNLLSEITQSNMVYYRTGNMQTTYQTGKCVNGEI